MPNLTRAPSSSGSNANSNNTYYHYPDVTSAPDTMSYYQPTRQLSGFYSDLTTTAGGNPMMAASYDPYAVNPVGHAVPSLQISTHHQPPHMGGPVGGTLPTQHRASSGAWNQEDDRTLLALRAMGKNWNQIQREAFPGKTGNACRKRHERLMERRGQNDFDNRKLERLCKEYMSMRKEIWQPLAARCGEKWNVVEMQCMSNGLKNIQSHARAYARRERLETGQPLPSSYDDDIGLGALTPIDDVAEQSYSSPETTGSTGAHSTPGAASSNGSSGHGMGHHYGGMPQYHQSYGHHTGYGHGYSNSVSSTGTAYGGQQQTQQQQQQSQNGGQSQGASPYMGHGGRLPSVGDMGIDAMLNRGQQQ
ncbi:hypothetical protein QC762_511550 [Podospora pseudocomata]|uniref:Myb-like domain-containing protein n=2 Tax=Podospora TaxID=5144 RepID=A0A090CU47_PODAN|nr:hypothetical protein QC762_511550 [Podospora pseudocomata]CDP30174.1 Putative protein of unknown function [Podospora anserina S mat+]